MTQLAYAVNLIGELKELLESQHSSRTFVSTSSSEYLDAFLISFSNHSSVQSTYYKIGLVSLVPGLHKHAMEFEDVRDILPNGRSSPRQREASRPGSSTRAVRNAAHPLSFPTELCPTPGLSTYPSCRVLLTYQPELRFAMPFISPTSTSATPRAQPPNSENLQSEAHAQTRPNPTGAGVDTGAGTTRQKTEAELEADRRYEEAMEEEYAKREGGA
ncbi:hypothetical protein F5Y18DRAFT_426923 [Xylariaceae sp. FL1019]|nr:hypothetical protein F5Y18DRAFT_426923 [Xylariaceae sp. FL1019]